MGGNLHLKSALAAARSGDRDGTDDHLAAASETAARIGTDRDDYRMCFGPTNVAIWSVGLAVEAQDGTEAVKRAEGFTPPPGAPRERVGHYWIDLARGWLLHGDRERALTALIKADYGGREGRLAMRQSRVARSGPGGAARACQAASRAILGLCCRRSANALEART